MMNSAPETQPEATAEDRWLAVDPAYLPYVRISFLIGHIFPLIAGVALIIFDLEEVLTRLAMAGSAVASLSLLWCIVFLAPRRYLRMRYCLRELDVNLQSGYLFWKSVSVSINRVQHIEVNQGPIQRKLGIAVLSVYTAGTMGSDMKIPGLAVAEANAVKSRLLNAINAEESEDDAE